MPRRNVRIVGIIEFEEPSSYLAEESRELWQDLLQIGSGAWLDELAFASDRDDAGEYRTAHSAGARSVAAEKVLTADLPRINADLEAELNWLLEWVEGAS